MRIPSWARVGAKVVCIRDLWEGRRLLWAPKPIIGSIYTISMVGASHNEWGNFGIMLDELKSYPYGYEIEAFRPLITQQDDIAAHFAHHLDQRAPENA